jgi:hypothetical protein
MFAFFGLANQIEDMPQAPFTFVCGEPALVERTSRALESVAGSSKPSGA